VVGGLKPYVEYEDSGLPWLGPVPEHWRVVRNGSLFGQRSQTGFAELPILEVSLKTGVQVRSFGGAKRKQVMSDLAKYKRAAKGDLAYNTMRMWQGALGVCPADGLVSPAYVVARPYAGVEARYFAALFRTGDYMAEIDAASRGIVKDRNRLYWDQFKQMQSPCPPPEEQAAIVRFLDWANGRLERAIRAKRKVIALLTEQKFAQIHQLVVRGSNALAPLKPTGNTWLDRVPAHWQVRRVRSCLIDTRAGVWGTDPAPGNENDQIVCVRVADFQMRTMTINKNKLTVRAVPYNARAPRLLEAGDILMEKSGGGEAEPVGRAVLFDLGAPAITSNFVVRLRVDKSIVDPTFLLHVLNAMQRSRRNAPYIKQTTGIQNLNEKAYFSLDIGIPPLEEQSAILAKVRQFTTPIDTAIDRMSREIELLREYRTRLVADVVTGKLDVREAAARLPDDGAVGIEAEPDDEADDPELLDEEATEA